MKLVTMMSGSTGNGYALTTSDETLIIEAGMRPDKSARCVHSPMVGCIVSHRHEDHAKYIKAYSKRMPVGGPEDAVGDIPSAAIFRQGETYHFGGFSVTPFPVPHTNADETPCPNFGYIIEHEEMGRLLFATDTYCLPYRIFGVNHFLIEANYDDAYIDEEVLAGNTTPEQRERIYISHMSLKGCISSIRQCGISKCRTIILCHLSSRHAEATHFMRVMQREIGIPTYVAEAGAYIPLLH